MPSRFVRLGTLLPAVFLLAACGDDATNPPTGGGGGGGGGPAQTSTVSVIDFGYAPSAITVATGATVTWNWTGAALHDVTFDDPSVGNSSTKTSGSFQRTFAAAGQFTYYCTVHGRSVMSGSVTVQ